MPGQRGWCSSSQRANRPSRGLMALASTQSMKTALCHCQAPSRRQPRATNCGAPSSVQVTSRAAATCRGSYKSFLSLRPRSMALRFNLARRLQAFWRILDLHAALRETHANLDKRFPGRADSAYQFDVFELLLANQGPHAQPSPSAADIAPFMLQASS
jgi:hypothetical protein